MKTTFKSLLVFALGVGAGVLASREYFKKHYEEISNEEIRSVKITFARKSIEMAEKAEQMKAKQAEKEPENTVNLNDYGKLVETSEYSSNQNSPEAKEMSENQDRPYVISPNDCGEFDDYEVYTLFHYADGVLTDDDNEIIDDVDDAVGEDYADHFGEYEDGAVYIRNNARHCDYEILMDLRNYYPDVAKTVPGHREV